MLRGLFDDPVGHARSVKTASYVVPRLPVTKKVLAGELLERRTYQTPSMNCRPILGGTGCREAWASLLADRAN